MAYHRELIVSNFVSNNGSQCRKGEKNYYLTLSFTLFMRTHRQYQWCCVSVAAPNNFYSVFKWKSAPSFISMNICCVCAWICVPVCHESVQWRTLTHRHSFRGTHTLWHWLWSKVILCECSLHSKLFKFALNHWQKLLVIKYFPRDHIHVHAPLRVHMKLTHTHAHTLVNIMSQRINGL